MFALTSSTPRFVPERLIVWVLYPKCFLVPHTVPKVFCAALKIVLMLMKHFVL